MKVWTHITVSLRETFDGRASEWALAVMTFLWSVVLTYNATLFADQPQTYHVLASAFSQSTWAVACGVVGSMRLLMLSVNGMWRRSPHMRAAGAFVTVGFWFAISYGVTTSGTFATGIAVYPVLLALDSYNVLRALRDAAVADVTVPRRSRASARPSH